MIFNEEQVRQALICCTETDSETVCKNCPYYNHNAKCLSKLHSDAFALINSQKAEIERLKTEPYQFADHPKKNEAEPDPTADVEVLKHGTWLSNPQTDEYTCSVCDGIAPVDSEKEDFYESNYCPNCGAKMDGKMIEDS